MKLTKKKFAIYLAVIIFVVGVLVAVFLLEKCVEFYDPITKRHNGECYAIWQKDYWDNY